MPASFRPYGLQPARLLLSMVISQTGILKWVTIPFSRGFFWPRVGHQQCPQYHPYLDGFILFPKLVFPLISPLVYLHTSALLGSLPPKPLARGWTQLHWRKSLSWAWGHPPPPPFSQHPSQLITFPVNSGIHFVYFHNVVSCPYSIKNIFPHFRVQVTQFIAIYSTKADSNSTDEKWGWGEILPNHHCLSVLEIKMVIHGIDYGK